MMQRTVLKVEIECAKCKKKLLKAVSAVPGVDKIEVDEVKGTLTVTGNGDPYEIILRTKRTGKPVEVVSIGPPPPPPKQQDGGGGGGQQQLKKPDDKKPSGAGGGGGGDDKSKSGGGDHKKGGGGGSGGGGYDETKKNYNEQQKGQVTTAQGWPMVQDPYSLSLPQMQYQQSLPQYQQIVVVPMTRPYDQYNSYDDNNHSSCSIM